MSASSTDCRPDDSVSRIADALAFWSMLATLAWAPFPLGSNRPWSFTVLIGCVGLWWTFLAVSHWRDPLHELGAIRRVVIPTCLFTIVLCWALIQTFPASSFGLESYIWDRAALVLSRNVTGGISVNVERTQTECVKFTVYILAALASFCLHQNRDHARKTLGSMIGISGAYSAYALALKAAGGSQYRLFYSTPPVDVGYVAGPFVLHNSFATFAGLGVVAAAAILMHGAVASEKRHQGLANSAMTVVQYLLTRGFWTAAAGVVCFSALVASASRAGMAATMIAIFSMFVAGAFMTKRRLTAGWAIGGIVIIGIAMIFLLALNGNLLAFRLNELIYARGLDEVRSSLWAAAEQMISTHPLAGIGLGAFQDAYPAYASEVLPYAIDKAHNDYLEFAAGVGMPCALAGWASLLWIGVRCLFGIFVRRRDRHFALFGFGAIVLVAIHSIFDFSLQIPAIALQFSVILGLATAQSYPSQKHWNLP